MATTAGIGDLVVVEAQLNYLLKNEHVKDPTDKEALRKYANKMILISSYMLEFKELEEIIRPISNITFENLKCLSEKRFDKELKKSDHDMIFDGYFLKLAKLSSDEKASNYILFTRSVPK